jgi:RNA polymerase sigma-70 factor (ECF subfamily)
MACLEEVASLARRLSRNPADADDLVQGTFERAFRSWRQLRHPGACRAWLFQIARNLNVNRQRYTASHPELRLVDDDESLYLEATLPAELTERLEASDLEKALERLPADQREAVLLCDLWGFEYQEIASITGWPVGTVRSRIARGRAKLASLLAAWSGEAQGRRQ